MRYLVKLKPLKPFFFGGDITFGKLGDEDNGTYLAHSRLFPQQSAILGMIRKEILLQTNLLTTKIKGEWVDKENYQKAKELVGDESFNIKSESVQDFGVIKKISPVFLIKDNERFIKKANINKYEYKDGLLKDYKPKEDIFDNFVSIDSNKNLKTEDIFKPITQIGIKKTLDKKEKENAFYKKTSYLFKKNFQFAFYLDIDFKLQSSFIKLGADDSVFKMEVEESKEDLNYEDKNGYVTLLSDCLITIPLKGNCEYAITKEISYQNLQTKLKNGAKFKKSEKVYLYEKGSIIIINQETKLLKHLENRNLQQIGYNKTIGGKK